MRSVLTKGVFRRLLTNEAYLFKCPRAAARAYRTGESTKHAGTLPSRSQNLPSRPVNFQQRRTLFGFSRKPPRQARTIDLDPGLSTMLDVSLMQKVGARPPELGKLYDSWRAYFAYKERKGEAVNSVQAVHVLRTFVHLQNRGLDEEISAGGADYRPAIDGLSLDDLRRSRSIMMIIPQEEGGNLEDHNKFARVVYEEIARRTALASEELDEEKRWTDLRYFVEGLALTGSSKEARPLVQNYWSRQSYADKTAFQKQLGWKMWSALLKGFAREGDEAALVDAARAAEEADVSFSPGFHEIMTTFYTSRNDIEKTKLWYGRDLGITGSRGSNRKPTTKTVSEILKFTIRNDQKDWSTTVFKNLLDGNPDKSTWDIIFQWAAGAMGKGVEDVARIMEVMKKHNADNPTNRPDIETINGLVALAMSKNDAYLAERYMQLGQRSGIFPNAKTYVLQMDYRIDAGDLPGAHEAYTSLQGQEVLSNEDVPVINKYIIALCNAETPHIDRINTIARDLDERRARLGATALSALCMLHLGRDDHQEVMDLLNTHTFHHTKAERAFTRDKFMLYIFDRDNDTIRAWDAYTIMRQMFDETDTEQRTAIMKEFFARKRSDMGTHVFGHMRQHIRPEARPVAATYVACFEGIAAAADAESLDMVYNMMKMDSSIEPSTTLYNALMLAYSSIEDPDKALDFWIDITNSHEGPNYRSLEIVFRVCQTKSYGDENAKKIWDQMLRMEIEITPEVFTSYVGALAGQALIDECQELIENAKAKFGIVVDHMT